MNKEIEIKELVNEMTPNVILYVETLMEHYEKLEKENKQLKETNKVLSQELTKDKILKQDCLTTCCGIPLGDIPKLKERIDKAIDEIKKELKENNHLSYGVALSIIGILNNYEEILKGDSNDE